LVVGNILNVTIDVFDQGHQGRRPVEAQDALLKGYLLKLTNSFMNPLVSWSTSVLSSVCPFLLVGLIFNV